MGMVAINKMEDVKIEMRGIVMTSLGSTDNSFQFRENQIEALKMLGLEEKKQETVKTETALKQK